MAKGYGSYCPLTLAAEVLGERWTLPLVMTLLDGTTRFNEMRRAMPRIPPSTLSQRLQTLEEAGVVAKRRGRQRSDPCEYRLTDAGRELEPILYDLAYWGQRWARDLSPDDLDTRSLAWSLHLRIDTAAMPRGRTVIEFDLSGEGAYCAPFWIVHAGGDVDICVKHPGFEVDLRVVAELRRFVEVWRGFRPLKGELRSGAIRLQGAAELRRAFPRWLLLSAAAGVERRRPGRERRLSRRTASA